MSTGAYGRGGTARHQRGKVEEGSSLDMGMKARGLGRSTAGEGVELNNSYIILV